MSRRKKPSTEVDEPESLTGQLPVDPPKKNLLFLYVSAALLIAWLVFLVAVAMSPRS